MAKSRLQAIKDRAKEIDSGGSGRASFLNMAVMDKRGIKKYKIKEKNWLCIIPPKDEKAYYGLPLEVHYRIGAAGDAFICLEKMFKQPCPPCEKRNALYAKGDVERSVVKPLYPSKRCLFLIVDYTSDATKAEGIQLFDAPFGVEEGAKKISTDTRTGEVGDISDPVTGKVFYFDCSAPGKPTAKYTGYNVEGRKPLEEAVLDSVFDLVELLVIPTYKEVAASFLGNVTNGAETTEPEPEPSSNEIVDHIVDDIESGGKTEDEPEPEAKDAEPAAEAKTGGLEDIKARIAAARAK